MPKKYWISVVSKHHIMRGVDGGFVMVCHGKERPLKRMKAGDKIINYSPTYRLEEKKPCQAFTAMGHITGDTPYQVDMGHGFIPYRLACAWQNWKDIAIRPLIEQLTFITDPKRWGYKFRFGHFEIPKVDFDLIIEQQSSL